MKKRSQNGGMVKVNKNEGGDAFPTIGEGNSQGVNYVEYSTGMSLRDYFAGQALAMFNEEQKSSMKVELCAKWSYSLSDAMLKERDK